MKKPAPVMVDTRWLMPHAWIRYEFALTWRNGRWVSTTRRVLAGLLLGMLLSGCHSQAIEQEREVIREGWALLHSPAPGDPEWETRRGQFFQDSSPWVGLDGRLGLPSKKAP